MDLQRFDGFDGFVLVDLPAAAASVGVVRRAPKVLVDSATLLARSLTYGFASIGQRRGGASCAVNAQPEDHASAMEAFVGAVAPLVAAGSLAVDPGKGVTEVDLAGLRSGDRRDARCRTLAPALIAEGAVAGASSALGDLAGRRVAVELHGAVGEAVCAALATRGATVVAVGNAAACVENPTGFDPAALAEALAAHGEDAVTHLGSDAGPAAGLVAVEADALFAGSRPGLVDHLRADALRARCLVPTGPVPVTAKGLAVAGRGGVTVLPDFVTTSGPLLAAWPDAPRTDEALLASVAETVEAVLDEVSGHPRGVLLGACERAETFLRTWTDDLPFGRPLA